MPGLQGCHTLTAAEANHPDRAQELSSVCIEGAHARATDDKNTPRTVINSNLIGRSPYTSGVS